MHQPTSIFAMLLVAVLAAACAAPEAAESPVVPEPTTSAPSDPSPDATVTASPTASTEATPAATPSPLPSSPAQPEVTLGFGARLVVGSAATLRTAPSSTANAIATVAPGDEVEIRFQAPADGGNGPIFGPAEAEGQTWYPVRPMGALQVPHTVGWLSIAESAAELDAAECPTVDEPTVTELAALAPQERLVCFGSHPIELEGPMPLSGLGGMVLGTWEPQWLAWPVNDGTPLGGSAAGERIGVRFAPGIEPPSLPAGADSPIQPVRVVGHFDHPDASTCMVQAPSALEPEPAAEVQLYCRAQFVVTEIELVGG